MPRRTKPEPAEVDLSKLVSRHVLALQSGKKGYKTADALLDVIESHLKPGDVVEVTEGKLSGKKFKFSDKFSDRSRLNVGMNARRYELEDVTAP